MFGGAGRCEKECWVVQDDIGCAGRDDVPAGACLVVQDGKRPCEVFDVGRSG